MSQMTPAERRSCIAQAQKYVEGLIRRYPPDAPLRIYRLDWHEFQPGVFSLVLHLDGRTRILTFSEQEFLDDFGSPPWSERLEKKWEQFLAGLS